MSYFEKLRCKSLKNIKGVCQARKHVISDAARDFYCIHRAILEAIKARDPKHAIICMQKHLQTAESNLKKMARNLNPAQAANGQAI
jgi:DNA-binding FadR family transcriptional regulator